MLEVETFKPTTTELLMRKGNSCLHCLRFSTRVKDKRIMNDVDQLLFGITMGQSWTRSIAD